MEVENEVSEIVGQLEDSSSLISDLSKSKDMNDIINSVLNYSDEYSKLESFDVSSMNSISKDSHKNPPEIKANLDTLQMKIAIEFCKKEFEEILSK